MAIWLFRWIGQLLLVIIYQKGTCLLFLSRRYRLCSVCISKLFLLKKSIIRKSSLFTCLLIGNSIYFIFFASVCLCTPTSICPFLSVFCSATLCRSPKRPIVIVFVLFCCRGLISRGHSVVMLFMTSTLIYKISVTAWMQCCLPTHRSSRHEHEYGIFHVVVVKVC